MAENKEKLRISLATPMPFEAVTKSKFMKPSDLCKLANNLFKSVFVDYVGCGININTQASNAGIVQFASADGLVNDVPQNAYYLTLYFQDLGVTAEADSGQYNALNRLHGNRQARRFGDRTESLLPAEASQGILGTACLRVPADQWAVRHEQAHCSCRYSWYRYQQGHQSHLCQAGRWCVC